MRVARMNTGAAVGKRGLIKFGVKGQTDIMGVMLPHGRLLCIEVKTATGQLSKHQRVFRRVVERFGALYIVARSVDDVRDALARDGPA